MKSEQGREKEGEIATVKLSGRAQQVSVEALDPPVSVDRTCLSGSQLYWPGYDPRVHFPPKHHFHVFTFDLCVFSRSAACAGADVGDAI